LLNQARHASLATNTSGAVVANSEERYTMKEESALGGIFDFNARNGVYPERREGTPRSGGS
jgi:hypothetical protein